MTARRNILALLAAAMALLPLVLAAGGPAEASVPASEAQATGTQMVMLGTAGGPEVRLKRNQSTTAIVVNGSVYLVDVGDAALQQMAKAGLAQAQVKAIFFTLFSQDRITGFPTFVSTRWMTSKKEPLPIFGPVGLNQTIAGIDQLLKPVATSSFVMSKDPVSGIQATELVTTGPVYSDANVTVSALALPRIEGRPPVAFAYRFETKAGSIVFTGATGAREALTDFARGADVLVSEVYDIDALVRKTGSPSSTPGLRERVLGHMHANHLSPEQIGTLANAAGVKQVVLHHLEPGSDDESANAMVAGYAAGVSKVFKGPVVLPHDLQTITLAPRK